ncbi:MAG: amidohydrolase [Saprospiraceae bacterium]|nr:amidohydrolase [Saprospiraceae bacterium]MCF8251771.1 amidohydrolase [Saprospiraceae bacterium]MCF8281257.1 amidohydrolase [Bacteroidales bacterium]MCF8313413.1 amidohydrolase [Saprospiraceae bacterium]MCF8442126.1 amidohydrolase [Saprospiraceae bacterium]
MMNKPLFLLVFVALFSCQNSKQEADTILLNGNVYTVDEANPTAQAIAIKDGLILRIGANEDMAELNGEKTEVIDLGGQFAMPGFIEGHGHFSGMGYSLIDLNFLKSKNWEEIVAAVGEAAKKAKPGEWIVGRGWHQEKWNEALEQHVQGYPYHDHLSEVSPNNPVVLRHASGHALIANKVAMDAAGISKESPDPAGGHIVRDPSGEAIGVFEERAMASIAKVHQEYLATLPPEAQLERWQNGIELAQAECLKHGVTSFQDAGSHFDEIERYKKMAEEGKLRLRLWAMVRHSSEELTGHLDGFPILDAGNRFFTCRAIKTEIDGALGSYGAWLLAPYNDKPGFEGQNTTTIEEVKAIAKLAFDKKMQLCVHTIGDRANRELLNVMEEITKSGGKSLNDLRWRSEHAQHIDPADIPRFAKLGVIAAMQGIHCTSDAPFVVKRLGEERARTGAYPWQSLLKAGAVVGNGTDVPVEDVSPIECFYASVTRKRHQASDKGLELFPEQKMTREQAIRSYTLSNAYAAFEDEWKGTLTPGKVADIVVFSNDLVNCSDEEILKTKVVMTMVNGKMMYNMEKN